MKKTVLIALSALLLAGCGKWSKPAMQQMLDLLNESLDLQEQYAKEISSASSKSEAKDLAQEFADALAKKVEKIAEINEKAGEELKDLSHQKRDEALRDMKDDYADEFVDILDALQKGDEKLSQVFKEQDLDVDKYTREVEKSFQRLQGDRGLIKQIGRIAEQDNEAALERETDGSND